MVKKTKGKHRLDKFYHLAKEQGYRSRAAFKLIQLNRKYDFLGSSRAVLDLCAAPGGWLQVAAKTMPVSSLIIGVDLVPIKPIRGVKTFIGDITTQKCRQQLRKLADGSRMDCVIHDGAPNVGGAWSSEAYTQSWLVLESLKLAAEFLAPKGTFVTKVFRSKDYTNLLYAFNQLFDKVEATKPAASRNASAEIFVVCLGFKAPGKIDPRIFDAKHLFQETVDLAPSAGPDALLKHKIKKQRHREGYEDGLSTSHKSTSAAAFVAADNPVEMLGRYTSFVIDGVPDGPIEGVPDGAALAARVAGHASTTREVRELVKDLQVLGRSEFKALLRWRMALRKEMGAEASAARKAAAEAATRAEEEEEGEGGKEGVAAEQAEEALLVEMAEHSERLDKQRKAERRRRHELKKKARVRAAQMALADGVAATEEGEEEGLFSLKGIKGKSAVDSVGETGALDDAELEQMEANSSDEGDSDLGEGGSDADSDDEARRYDAQLDEAFEESYQSYLERQHTRRAAAAAAAEAAAAKKRKRLGMAGELDGDEEEKEEEEYADDGLVAPAIPDDDYDEAEQEAGGGLLVSLDKRRVSSRKAAGPGAVADQWFSQDLFNDPALLEEDDEEEDHAAGRTQQQQQQKGAGKHKPAAAASGVGEDGRHKMRNGGGLKGKGKQQEEEGGATDEDEVDADFIRSAKRSRKEARAAAAQQQQQTQADGGGQQQDGEGAGFEVVPQSDDEGGSSGSDAAEFDDLDDDAKAEIRALAKRMLSGPQRRSIIEAAYNRYAFHDEGLPRWFMEDEQKHMRPIIDISKEEVDDARAALRAIDARPIKKVAEARARKRKRMTAKVAAARTKAEAIAAQDDVPMASKMREIEKVMNKARATGFKKGGKEKEGKRGRGKGRKGPPLDARTRSDQRQVNAKSKRKAEKKAKSKGRAKKAAKAGK